MLCRSIQRSTGSAARLAAARRTAAGPSSTRLTTQSGGTRFAAAQVVDLDERTRTYERGGVVVEGQVEVEAGAVGADPPGIEQLGPVGFPIQTLVVPDCARKLRLEATLLLVAGGHDPAVALGAVGVDQRRVELLLVGLERRLDRVEAVARRARPVRLR